MAMITLKTIGWLVTIIALNVAQIMSLGKEEKKKT